MELSINATADHLARQTGEFYFAIIGKIPRAIDTCFGRDGRPIKQWRKRDRPRAFRWGRRWKKCWLLFYGRRGYSGA